MDEFGTSGSDGQEKTKIAEVPQSVQRPEDFARNNSVEQALQQIRDRSFAGRNPELGRMIKCQICQTRHRQFERVCKQKFVKRGELEMIAGQTPETETVVEARKIRVILGAAVFNKKRLKPHPNKRQLQFVDLVRKLLPDEYTQEDMNIARQRAKRQLIKIHGRHGFLPPVWQRRKEENVQQINS
jgi:hypothetical protein